MVMPSTGTVSWWASQRTVNGGGVGGVYCGDEVVAAGGDRLPLGRHPEAAEVGFEVVGDAVLVDEARRQVGAAHRVDRREADQVGEQCGDGVHV